MSQHPDFVSEFDVSDLIEQAQTNPLGLQTDRVAVESQIAESTRSAEEVRAAFQAMQQAQQPTTFDKIGDVALAVAAIVDLSGGGGSLADRRKRAEAGAKFRSLRAGRTERKQTKRDQQFQKFIQQMKLREFTGDISSRNFALLQGLGKQERQNLMSNLEVAFKAEELKSVTALRKAQTEKLGKEPKEPTAAEIAAAKQKALGEIWKVLTSQVDKEFPPYDSVKHGLDYPTAEDYRLAKKARFRELFNEYRAFVSPQKPEIGRLGVGDLLKAHADTGGFNPADFLPAIEAGGAPLFPGEGGSSQLIPLPPSPLQERMRAISPLLVPQR